MSTSVKRIYDRVLISEAINTLIRKDREVDVDEWVANPDNIVLQNSQGDLALFEKGIRDIYSGHYFFKCRGRGALTSAKEFLDEIFNSCYNIDILMGLVPLGNLGARWLTRQVGFKSQGPLSFDGRHYEMFVITKKEFNNE